jgi:DNA-binding GntR family transcriptional regulator
LPGAEVRTVKNRPRRHEEDKGVGTGLVQRAYDWLRKEILTCELSPGSWIREDELQSKLGVSRTPIRLALTKLQEDGLVQRIERKGYLVAQISLQDIKEIYEMRLILEKAAASLAVDRITDAEIEGLRRFVEIPSKPVESRSIFEALAANESFHLGVCTAARNRRLTWHLRRVLSESSRPVVMDLIASGQSSIAWDQGHERILECLSKRDKAAMIAAVQEDNLETLSRLLHLKIGEVIME